MKPLAAILLALGFALAGLAGGWWLRHLADPQPPEPVGAEDETEIDAGALAELGVEFAFVEPESFVRTRELQGVVVGRPENERPVVAPVAGRLESIRGTAGHVVKAGDVVAVILRDPIPRPELPLTGELLQPVREEVHEAVVALRSARAGQARVQKELDRIAPFIRDQTMPQKEAITLEFQRDAFARAADGAIHELEHHGLVDAEIAAIARGEAPPPHISLWPRVLRLAKLWHSRADKVLAALPPATREAPWTLAALGELAGRGLVDDALAALVQREPSVRDHFDDVASLLLAGNSLEHVTWRATSGALAARVEVRVPEGAAEDYDVSEVVARAATRVEVGDPLLRLMDPRRLYLLIEALGSEAEALTAAASSGASFTARPLDSGAGPALSDLQLTRLLPAAQEEGRLDAWVGVDNHVLTARAAGGMRGWALRTGVRYLVELPLGDPIQALIVPEEALVRDGAGWLLYEAHGDHFDPIRVEPLYRDGRRAVLALDAGVAPDARIAWRGAFALHLALQGGGEAVAHGHSHD